MIGDGNIRLQATVVFSSDLTLLSYLCLNRCSHSFEEQVPSSETVNRNGYWETLSNTHPVRSVLKI